MSDEFPHPCNDCGMCCLMSVCPVGLHVLGIPEQEKNQPCPLLKWEGTKSKCGLADRVEPEKQEWFFKVMGFGKGCCMKGTYQMNGIVGQWDELPGEIKIKIAQETRNGKITASHA